MTPRTFAMAAVLAASGLPFFAGSLLAQDKPRRESINAVVRVESVFSEPDFFIPWQDKVQSHGIGSGVVLSGHRILTNAHNVADSTFVSVRRQEDDALYPARVVAVDHECDLAILAVEEEGKFFEGMVPFALGTTPPTQSQVLVAGFPIGGDGISLTQGIISRIETRPYAHSGKTLLAAQIDAAVNPGNSGGPVLFDNQVVGIAFQVEDGGEALGYMIPTEVIQHFLADLKDGRVDGFGGLEFDVVGLDNPDARRSLKMKPGQAGVLVYKVHAGMPAAGLRMGDVLLAIDGRPIANNGNIRLPDGEARAFSTLLAEKQVGESVAYTVLREGKELTVSLPVRKVECQVGPKVYDRMPDYYVAGGLVFTTLSASYLGEWKPGEEPINLLAKADKPRANQDEETIVLSQVLADKVNMGYQDLWAAVLVSVDGKKIRNLRELVAAVEGAQGEFITFAFEDDPPVILDTKKLRAATPRILERYRVPADRSKNLR